MNDEQKYPLTENQPPEDWEELLFGEIFGEEADESDWYSELIASDETVIPEVEPAAAQEIPDSGKNPEALPEGSTEEADPFSMEEPEVLLSVEDSLSQPFSVDGKPASVRDLRRSFCLRLPQKRNPEMKSVRPKITEKALRQPHLAVPSAGIPTLRLRDPLPMELTQPELLRTGLDSLGALRIPMEEHLFFPAAPDSSDSSRYSARLPSVQAQSAAASRGNGTGRSGIVQMPDVPAHPSAELPKEESRLKLSPWETLRRPKIKSAAVRKSEALHVPGGHEKAGNSAGLIPAARSVQKENPMLCERKEALRPNSRKAEAFSIDPPIPPQSEPKKAPDLMTEESVSNQKENPMLRRRGESPRANHPNEEIGSISVCEADARTSARDAERRRCRWEPREKKTEPYPVRQHPENRPAAPKKKSLLPGSAEHRSGEHPGQRGKSTWSDFVRSGARSASEPEKKADLFRESGCFTVRKKSDLMTPNRKSAKKKEML